MGRIARVLVLDPTFDDACKDESYKIYPSSFTSANAVLPSCVYMSNDIVLPVQETAYLTPLFAFNLGLHLSWLGAFSEKGVDVVKSLFENNKDFEKEKAIMDAASLVHVDILPWLKPPMYATYVEISSVKIPETYLQYFNGMLQSEKDERQNIVDLAIKDYFKVDRFCTRGDIFCIHIKWRCNSEMCVACSLNRSDRSSIDVFTFKVLLFCIDSLFLRFGT